MTTRQREPADYWVHNDAKMFEVLWETCKNSYRCRIAVSKEEAGGYSAFAVNLPGVVSQGETEREAIEGIREALRGSISVYLSDNDFEGIPWNDTPVDIPQSAVDKWISVHV